jgi:hypothetical protein
MTWEAYWLPNLTTWIGGGIITAAVGGAVGLLVRRWLQQIFGQQQATTEDTRDAAFTAADRAGDTNQKMSEFKDRFDDVYAALIEERLQEARMRRIEDNQDRILRFMADLETERHTTGNLAEFQRAARSTHE